RLRRRARCESPWWRLACQRGDSTTEMLHTCTVKVCMYSNYRSDLRCVNHSFDADPVQPGDLRRGPLFGMSQLVDLAVVPERASLRAQSFSIPGCSDALTQSVPVVRGQDAERSGRN